MGPLIHVLDLSVISFVFALYVQCIGVHWRVPNGLVARQDVFGKGVRPASLGEAGRPAAFAQHEFGTCDLRNFCVWTPNWVNQMSNLIISMSSLTWQCQIWHLTMFVIVSSYVHVSPSLNMLHLVLFLAYSEHNPANHLIPPKLVEFVSLKQIMCRNIFIPS